MAALRSLKALFFKNLHPVQFIPVLFPAMLVLALCAVSYAGAGPATFGGVSGEVYLKAAGEARWRAALKGDTAGPGDTVRTGPSGRALLEFPDGTEVSLGDSTILKMTRLYFKPKKRKAVLSLLTGKLRAVVKGYSGKTDISVRTPTSVSGVKGTDFIVMNSGRANVVFGQAGAVRFAGTGLAAGEGVTALPGTMTENTGGAEPIEPVAVPPGSLLEQARERLEAVTDVYATVQWEEAGRLPEILARWNINYGHYLAESRSYDTALDVLLIAADLTDSPAIRAEAHVGRGTIYSRNLNEPRKALKEYAAVMDAFPVEPYLENAVYSTGMIYMDLKKKRSAQKYFRRYLEDYPDGAHAGTIEVLSRELEKD